MLGLYQLSSCQRHVRFWPFGVILAAGQLVSCWLSTEPNDARARTCRSRPFSLTFCGLLLTKGKSPAGARPCEVAFDCFMENRNLKSKVVRSRPHTAPPFCPGQQKGAKMLGKVKNAEGSWTGYGLLSLGVINWQPLMLRIYGLPLVCKGIVKQ